MAEQNIQKKYLFHEEPALQKQVNDENPWKVLVADDEEVIHKLTKMVLQNYSFEGRSIKLFGAYSGKETLEILGREKDIALVLLDVVMETEDAGLLCAKDIRERLQNHSVRIILRTGQPGQAPERDIIINYEINDYKAKSELTSQKLFTVITTSLRDYKHIDTITRNKNGLENIIAASQKLFKINSFSLFATGILQQLTSILDLGRDSLYINYSSLSAIQEYHKNTFTIRAATGVYSGKEDLDVVDVIPSGLYSQLMEAVRQQKSVFSPDAYIGYFETQKGEKSLLLFQWQRNLNEIDHDLISIFGTNVAAAFENISMNNEISATQKEIIFTFSEVVEGRSKETVKHLRRVTEAACLIAQKIGMSFPEIEMLRLTVPMHDIGKVGTPDSILMKPERLSPEEYEIMKEHTEIGFNIFKNSTLEMMSTAATIAYEHHEKWNGKGYPQGLKGDEIHIFARITALVDVVDALANKRCYKKAWSMDDVLYLIKKERGEHFEPRIVDAFLDSLDEYIEILNTNSD
ncbi:MAG: DUF3369 domain-containing protein [Spirochaetales bacterium]|nr:DUF3369 domain-containing protein [Spirochaetales bacterium]